MEIKLPATLTARYEDKIERVGEKPFRFNRVPGDVVLEFGEMEVGRFPVTQSQHDILSASAYFLSDEDRAVNLSQIVANWLGERLFGKAVS